MIAREPPKEPNGDRLRRQLPSDAAYLWRHTNVRRVVWVVVLVGFCGGLGAWLAGCKKPAEQVRESPQTGAMKQGAMKRLPLQGD